MTPDSLNRSLVFCNVTFESSHEVNSKLFRCSGCRGCWYRTKVDQKQHWKIHKTVCKPPDGILIQRVNQMSMKEVTNEIFRLVRTQSFDAGQIWTLLFQKLDELFTSGERSSWLDRENESSLSGLCCFFELRRTPDQNIEQLWATPGFTNMILNLDFISSKMKEMQENAQLPTPKELLSFDYDPACHDVPERSDLFSLVLCMSVICRDEDNRGYIYRPNAIAKAAAGKILNIWKDPHSHASMTLHKTNASARQLHLPLLVMTVIDETIYDRNHPTEIATGLSLEDAILTIIQERNALFGKYENRLFELCSCIVETADYEIEAWEHFSVEARVKCALEVVRHMIKSRPSKDDLLCNKMANYLGVNLIGTISGWTKTKKDGVMRLQFLEEASKGRTPMEDHVNPNSMCPADYFGLKLEKVRSQVEPCITTYVEVISKRYTKDGLVLPDILGETGILYTICDFASEPFSDNVQDEVVLQYLANTW